jgi:flagellar hook-associated protein 2
MASVTIGGLASGLPPNLVDQLVQAERMPIKNLEVRKDKDQTKLGLVNDLESKIRAIGASLAGLASQKGFNDIKLESGDPNVISGTVDPSMAPKGSWNVEVVSLAQKAGAVTNGFPDKDTSQIGVVYFKFYTPQGTKEVYINGNNNTLEKAAAAINQAGVGMKALVINDRKDPDAPFKLIITGDGVGGENMVKYPSLYFLDGDQDIYFESENEAKNGVVKVDGMEFEIADNTLKDVIPGVTLELRQASPGRSINVSVSENREAVSTKVGDFVKAMNEALGFIQSQLRVNDKTDTSRTLGGESMVRSLEGRLRSLIQNPQYGVGEINRLNQLGIEMTREGVLKFDEDKFNSVLQRTPDQVRQFFAGDGFSTGFINVLKREIATVTNPAIGQISLRKKALEDSIERIDKSIEGKERQLLRREEQLRNKFAKLEETMSRLKSQGGAVASIGSVGPSLGGAVVQS